MKKIVLFISTVATFGLSTLHAQIRVISPAVRNVAKQPTVTDTTPKPRLILPKRINSPSLISQAGGAQNFNVTAYPSIVRFKDVIIGGKEFPTTTNYSVKKNIEKTKYTKSWEVNVECKKIDAAYDKAIWQLSTIPFTAIEVDKSFLLAEEVFDTNGADSIEFKILYKYPTPIQGTAKLNAVSLIKIKPITPAATRQTSPGKGEITINNANAALQLANNNLNERKLYIRVLLFSKEDKTKIISTNPIVVVEKNVNEFSVENNLTPEQIEAQKYMAERSKDMINLQNDYLITNVKYKTYEAVDYNYYGCTVVTGYAPGQENSMFAKMIPIGTEMCPKKGGSDGWFEKVFKAVVNFVKAVIDGTAKFYNDTKKYIKEKFRELNCGNGNTIAVVNPASKLNKLAGDDVCNFVSDIAFEAGVAAVGLPPSLPNTEVMTNMAKGQIVDVMCDKIEAETGVPLPGEVRNELKKEFNKQIEDALKKGTVTDGVLQLKPHPKTIFKPVMLEFEITRVAKNYTKNLRLPLSFSIGETTTRDISEYVKKTNCGGLSFLSDALFENTYATIPYIDNVGDKATVYAILSPQSDRYLHGNGNGGYTSFSNVETYNQDYYHINKDSYESIISSSRAFLVLYSKESTTNFNFGLKTADNVGTSFQTSNQ